MFLPQMCTDAHRQVFVRRFLSFDDRVEPQWKHVGSPDPANSTSAAMKF